MIGESSKKTLKITQFFFSSDIIRGISLVWLLNGKSGWKSLILIFMAHYHMEISPHKHCQLLLIMVCLYGNNCGLTNNIFQIEHHFFNFRFSPGIDFLILCSATGLITVLCTHKYKTHTVFWIFMWYFKQKTKKKIPTCTIISLNAFWKPFNVHKVLGIRVEAY